MLQCWLSITAAWSILVAVALATFVEPRGQLKSKSAAAGSLMAVWTAALASTAAATGAIRSGLPLARYICLTPT